MEGEKKFLDMTIEERINKLVYFANKKKRDPFVDYMRE